MNDLYLVIDNFDAEPNLFAGLEDVQAFLKRRYQQNPVLYQILPNVTPPRLIEHDIPEDWKYVDPDEEEEGQTT